MPTELIKEKPVYFAFSLDEKVHTPFGAEGFVSMCAIDGEGKIYYVKTEKNSDWYKENMLKKISAE